MIKHYFCWGVPNRTLLQSKANYTQLDFFINCLGALLIPNLKSTVPSTGRADDICYLVFTHLFSKNNQKIPSDKQT